MSDIQFTRRAFIEGLGLTTTGLFFGCYASAAKPTTEPAGRAGEKPKTTSVKEENTSKGLNPNVFVHLGTDGIFTVVCHRSEMGQGIRSSLPVLLADEFGADMKKVKIVQGDGDKAYGDQNTDGSNSVRSIYDDMRRAAATARMMLIEAAAEKMKVPADSLKAEDHFVTHRATGRRVAFADLAVAAGAMKIPQPNEVKFRPDKELRRVGKKLPLIDGPAYVTGKAEFGADIRLPNMLIALIARPPVVGGKTKKYDKKAALAIAGVKHVIELPTPKAPYGFQPAGGVAVVAENTWAAMKGREALAITWDHGSNVSYSTPTYRESLFKSVRAPGTVLRKVGDVEKALSDAASKVEAEYYVPHLPHVAMEPPVAIARYDREQKTCEVWAPTQNPQAAQTEVARALGVAEKNVTVHVTFLGGGFGRKSKADFCSEAALLAKEVGAPVRVQWTRPDDIHNDYVNTVSAQRLTAGLDKDGKVTAWHLRIAFPPIASTFALGANEPGEGDLQQGVLDLALDIPNIQAEACKAEAHVRIGWLRSVYNIFHAFATNSFIDEIAHARGKDSLENMLEIYGPPRQLSLEQLGVKKLANYGASLERHPVDAARLRGVLEQVAAMAKWKQRAKKKGAQANLGMGIAAHRSFNSYTAVVAAVSKSKSGEISVDEVWIAVDAGLTINPDRVRAQMEGSVINGMSYLLHGGITHKDGAVEQNNFDGVGLVRMAAAPKKINVEIMNTKNNPGGIGEPGLPPVAPAVANAIFSLTGKRIREFGLANSGLT
jgi:isoquinoline 1-oxidoreductase beta subunit